MQLSNYILTFLPIITAYDPYWHNKERLSKKLLDGYIRTVMAVPESGVSRRCHLARRSDYRIPLNIGSKTAEQVVCHDQNTIYLRVILLRLVSANEADSWLEMLLLFDKVIIRVKCMSTNSCRRGTMRVCRGTRPIMAIWSGCRSTRTSYGCRSSYATICKSHSPQSFLC